MSKYNLQDILNEYVGGSRHGTIKISYRDLQDAMDTIERQGDFVVRELPGPSGDGKTNREFEVVYIGNVRKSGKEEGGFTVYDYKFGFDPGSQEHFDEEYEFSIGGNNKRNALILARDLLGPAVKGYFGDDQKIVNSYTPQMANDVIMSLDRNMDDEGEMTDYAADVEIDSMNEEEMSKSDKNKLKKVSSQLKKSVKAHDKQSKTIDSIISEADTSKLTDDEKKELKFHLDQFKKGNIDREDIMNVLDQFGLNEENVIKDLAQADEVIKIIKMMNPDVRQDLLKRIARMGQKLSENGHVDDYADEIEEGHAMSDNEADLESGVKGNMDAFTEEFIGESTQEESVAKYIIDYYRNPNKPEESMVTDEMVGEYFRTHKDWDQEGRWDGSKEGMEDGMKDFDEFFDANYGYMFDDSRLDEDKDKKELPQSIKDKEARDAEIEAKKAKGMMKENMYLDHDEFMEEIVMDHFSKKGVSMNVVKDFLKTKPEAIEMRGKDLDAEFESYMEMNSLNEVRKHFKRFMFKKYQ